METPDDVISSNVKSVDSMESDALSKRSRVDTLSDAISGFCGNFGFVVSHFIWFVVWVLLNTVSPLHHFDPFPFNFLTLVVSLEAIFLSSFIMISQNAQAALSEQRSKLDLQVNLLAEQETTRSLQLLKSIAIEVGVKDFDDPSVDTLSQVTPPDLIANKLSSDAL